MKILVKAVAGSHLFGTNTEKSDKDFKGVFMPDANQIILGNYSDTVRKTTGDDNSRNTKDDVDIELYSLRKFFLMIENGDTAALELLFTPDHLILEKDPLWDEIIAIRDTLVSKKVNALLGYIRQQANKYGIKGSRMGELNNIIKSLKDIEKTCDFHNAKFKHKWEEVVKAAEGYQHVHVFDLPLDNKNNITVPALNILGKKFSHDTPFSVAIKSLSDTYKSYGQRAREAANNSGIDWKAISHCLRCGIQAIELMETGKITLPHTEKNKTFLLQVKNGEIEYKRIEPIIEKTLDDVETAACFSSLTDSVSRQYLDELLLKFYKAEIYAQVS
jgi:hypothetical protein